MSVAISPTDPNMFASGSVDASAKVWDLRTGKSTHTSSLITDTDPVYVTEHFFRVAARTPAWQSAWSQPASISINLQDEAESDAAEKKFAQHEITPGYVSEARDQAAAGGVKPQLYGQGLIPGYGGHKREAKFAYGSSIYVNGIPQGSETDNKVFAGGAQYQI